MRTICILKIFLYHLILRTVYINYMNIIVVHAVCVSDMCMGKIVAIMGHIAHTHTVSENRNLLRMRMHL